MVQRMKEGNNKSGKSTALYNRAESLLRQRPQQLHKIAPEEIYQLIDDLKSRLIEVELQNEKLHILQRKIEEDRQGKSLAKNQKDTSENYRVLVDNSINGIAVTQDSLLKFVNPIIFKMTGYSENELISRPFVDFIHPEDRELVMNYHRSRMKGEEAPKTYPFRIIDKNGNTLWLENNVTMITWKGQTAVLNFLQDITARKQAEVTIQESKATIQAMIDAAPETMLLVDTEGIVLVVNQIGANRIGLCKDEIIGQSLFDFLEPETSERIMQNIKQMLTSEKPLCFADKHMGRHYYNSLYPVFALNGDVEKIAIFAQDLTRQRQTEVALRESEEKYRLLFENESDAVMIFDAGTMRFEDANRATLNLFGYSKNEFLTLTVMNISAEKDKTRIAIQKIRDRKPESTHVPVRHFIKKDGSRFPGEIYTGQFTSGGRQKIIGSVRDISERMQAQEALRSSEARYRALSDATFEAIFISEKGICLDVNNRSVELFGFDYDELIGIFGTDVIAPESKERVRQNILSGYEKPYEAIAQKKDGTKFHVEICGKMMKYKDKDVRITVIRDISDQKRAEKALRKSEKRYRNLFNSIPIGMYRTTKEGLILDVNPAMVKILGYPDREKLLHIKFFEHHTDPDDWKKFQSSMKKKGSVHDFTVQLYRHDGKKIWVSISATVVYDAESRMTYFEGAMVDMTERKQTEAHIQNLSHLLMRAQENERQMISRELHDGVAQDLALLKITSDMLFDQQATICPEIKPKAQEFSNLIQRVILSVRNLAYDLRPPGLDEMGLVTALSMYCDDFSKKSGVNVDFEVDGIDQFSLDSDIEINIYRLIQEGLNNIRKHAHAGQAKIKLAGDFPNIILRIEDDGIGFDVEERKNSIDGQKRMGLRSMSERVNLLEGQMDVQSSLGNGTKIIIKFPLQGKKAG
jgi:PAS domain S-box-containing protein